MKFGFLKKKWGREINAYPKTKSPHDFTGQSQSPGRCLFPLTSELDDAALLALGVWDGPDAAMDAAVAGAAVTFGEFKAALAVFLFPPVTFTISPPSPPTIRSTAMSKLLPVDASIADAASALNPIFTIFSRFPSISRREEKRKSLKIIISTVSTIWLQRTTSYMQQQQ